MSDNEIEWKVKKVRRYLAVGLRSIAAWNKVVPLIQQTDEQLGWIENSISQSPSSMGAVTSEELLDYLDKAEKAIAILETISVPPIDIGPTLNTSGSAPSWAYGVFLGKVYDSYRNQPEVVGWVRQTLLAGERLITIQKRSELVQKRLMALGTELGALHKQGVEATLAAQAEVQTPIEPGAVLDRSQ